MTAKPAKTGKSAKSAASAGKPIGAGKAIPLAAANPDADAEKTFFRVRVTDAAAFDTLGTPADPPLPGVEAPPPSEPGLLGRLLGGSSRPARPPRRRTPQPVEAAAPVVPVAEGVDAPVIEPEQEPAGPDDAVDSYRSASDLTAPEDAPQSDVVA